MVRLLPVPTTNALARTSPPEDKSNEVLLPEVAAKVPVAVAGEQLAAFLHMLQLPALSIVKVT